MFCGSNEEPEVATRTQSAVIKIQTCDRLVMKESVMGSKKASYESFHIVDLPMLPLEVGFWFAIQQYHPLLELSVQPLAATRGQPCGAQALLLCDCT